MPSQCAKSVRLISSNTYLGSLVSCLKCKVGTEGRFVHLFSFQKKEKKYEQRGRHCVMRVKNHTLSLSLSHSLCLHIQRCTILADSVVTETLNFVVTKVGAEPGTGVETGRASEEAPLQHQIKGPPEHNADLHYERVVSIN